MPGVVEGTGDQGPGISPYDTAASSGLRFLAEVIAWVAGPWAAAELTGRWWVAIPAAVVLVGVVSVFSTPGDKRNVVVATPGPVRSAIELFMVVVAVAGAWVAWPTWLAVVVTVVAVAALVAGYPRARWLARGAPTPPALS